MQKRYNMAWPDIITLYFMIASLHLTVPQFNRNKKLIGYLFGGSQAKDMINRFGCFFSLTGRNDGMILESMANGFHSVLRDLRMLRMLQQDP